MYNSGRYFRLETLICDDCAQILDTVNLVKFFTVDPDVNVVAIWVVVYQFCLLCSNFHAKGCGDLIQKTHLRG